MMHVAMTKELKEGMAKMKYSLNHYWRFDYYWIAFLTGLMQTSVIILVSLLNYYVIIFVSHTVIDIAKDFIALMIISEFDNIFYEEHSDREISKKIILEKDDLYVEMFTIQTTTSKDAYAVDDNENFNKFKPLASSLWIEKFMKSIGNRPVSRPRSIHITQRTPGNRVLYRLVYQPLRFAYVSFWFYFSPFFLITVQFILPLYVLQRQKFLVGEFV